MFQSTHPRRVRLKRLQRVMRISRFQSTHPRRVRLDLLFMASWEESFNPRTHVGCDDFLCIEYFWYCKFQSTHPRRVRPTSRGLLQVGQMFQSTHPRRVRPQDGSHFTLDLKFQSTHPRRVRHQLQVNPRDDNQFQSTHPRRVRLSSNHSETITDEVSIHAPT